MLNYDLIGLFLLESCFLLLLALIMTFSLDYYSIYWVLGAWCLERRRIEDRCRATVIKNITTASRTLTYSNEGTNRI